MSIQSEMEEAAKVYDARLTKQAESDRLAALRIEARHENNAAAFAHAVEAALTSQHDTNTDQEN